MTPTELKAACNALPLTHAQIAEKIGVSEGHLRNCLYGQRNLSKASLLLLDALCAEFA